MSTYLTWCTFLFISTVLLSYLVFETLSIPNWQPHNCIPSKTGLVPHNFSGTLKENDGWATKRLPKQGGFLQIQYNETLEVKWGIPMFHGLHCIKMLGMTLARSPLPKSATHEDVTVPGHSIDPHLAHCIDYITQVRRTRTKVQKPDANAPISSSFLFAVGIQR
jgi:hypothetical protein